MSITYNFKVTNINCYSEYESLSYLAFNVWWNYIGTDGEYTSNVIGNTEIPYDPNTEYVPYGQLTEAEVISWIEQYTDPSIITNAQELIAQRINEQINPPNIINPTLPWDK
jgi:hypothetical protein